MEMCFEHGRVVALALMAGCAGGSGAPADGDRDPNPEVVAMHCVTEHGHIVDESFGTVVSEMSAECIGAAWYPPEPNDSVTLELDEVEGRLEWTYTVWRDGRSTGEGVTIDARTGYARSLFTINGLPVER